jgi:hypothetical protein
VKHIYPADSGMVVLGSLSNIALGAQLRLDDGLIQHYFYLEQVKASLINSVTAQKLIDVWAWIYFAMNTTMTVSIIYKILYVARFCLQCS